jgi:hypothetical protein
VIGVKSMRARNRKKRDELGTNAAGQSGDIQQLSDVADADSESVVQLLEEGNAFEASAVKGVENAKDPDVSEVTTHQVPEDNVPEEYRNPHLAEKGHDHTAASRDSSVEAGRFRSPGSGARLFVW